jgi:hypothetical protein
MLMMSFFRIPKSVLDKLDYYISRFFLALHEHKKYRLATWSILHKPKSIGGWALLTGMSKINACCVNGLSN